MKLSTWLTDGLQRVHLHSQPMRSIRLLPAACGERLSLQVAVRWEPPRRPVSGLRKKIRQIEWPATLPVSIVCRVSRHGISR
jgi:hypothetical protein